MRWRNRVLNHLPHTPASDSRLPRRQSRFPFGGRPGCAGCRPRTSGTAGPTQGRPMSDRIVRRMHEVFGYGLDLKERLERGEAPAGSPSSLLSPRLRVSPAPFFPPAVDATEPQRRDGWTHPVGCRFASLGLLHTGGLWQTTGSSRSKRPTTSWTSWAATSPCAPPARPSKACAPSTTTIAPRSTSTRAASATAAGPVVNTAT